MRTNPHTQSHLCDIRGRLCSDPTHWRWRGGNATPEPFYERRWWLRVTNQYPFLHASGAVPDVLAFDFLLEDAMGGDRCAIKALGILAWHPHVHQDYYSKWRPTVLALIRHG